MHWSCWEGSSALTESLKKLERELQLESAKERVGVADMHIEFRIKTEEGSEFIVTNTSNEETVYVTIGNSSEVVEINIQDLLLGLRKLMAR